MDADTQWVFDLIYIVAHCFAAFAGLRYGGTR